MPHLTRNALWLGFFASILFAWVWLYMMATGMGLDWIGRMQMPMMGDEMSMDDTMPGETSSTMADGMTMGEGAAGGMAMDGGADSAMAPNDDTGMSGMTMEGGSGTGMAMNEDMDMGGMDMGSMNMGGMDMGSMDMSGMTRFGPLFLMWAIMMAAMMLPTMVPTLRAYEDLMTSADGTRIGWLGVLGGYSIAWVAFAAAITGVQLALLQYGVIDMMGVAKNLYISAALLVVVGLFQFSRTKEVCHGVCHSPMTYFLGHWRPDAAGGLRMGLGLGAFCVGCCWGFMALGFVGGVMSLLWMGLATLFMVIEKLPEVGHRVTRPMGAILVAAGIALAIWTATGG